MDPESFFRNARTHPAYWEHYARTLKRASDLLWSVADDAIGKYMATAAAQGKKDWLEVAVAGDFDIQLGDPSILLLGASIENLLKGILVARGSEGAEIERFGHRLSDMFRAAGLKPTKRQTWLLKNLQEGIEWRSKYPAPKLSKKAPPVYWELERENYPELLALWDICAKALDSAWQSSNVPTPNNPLAG